MAILSEQPQQRSALVKLLDVYRRGELRPPEIQESLSIIDKLLDLAMTPASAPSGSLPAASSMSDRYTTFVRARADYERAIGQWLAMPARCAVSCTLAVGEPTVRTSCGTWEAQQRANAFLGEVQHVTALALTLPTESADAETLLARRKQALALLENVEPEDMAEALASGGRCAAAAQGCAAAA